MSVFEDISEDVELDLITLRAQENALRSAYDTLSALWERRHNAPMVIVLDDLLEVWEKVKLYRTDLEQWAKDFDKEI